MTLTSVTLSPVQHCPNATEEDAKGQLLEPCWLGSSSWNATTSHVSFVGCRVYIVGWSNIG
jgi:hypothetical protein